MVLAVCMQYAFVMLLLAILYQLSGLCTHPLLPDVDTRCTNPLAMSAVLLSSASRLIAQVHTLLTAVKVLGLTQLFGQLLATLYSIYGIQCQSLSGVPSKGGSGNEVFCPERSRMAMCRATCMPPGFNSARHRLLQEGLNLEEEQAGAGCCNCCCKRLWGLW